ncbi:hypothetical protein K0040_18640 [Terrisporobacter petrolearius]|uniref:hypothetical protein n=1 Tax=Terrisporobacter petrolearius TaxID=1460447 RepID=UPI001D15F025|nr:hypothetical protein [Terrisporobacter petrolearius]MCC3866269.1 hypothetical protein [Terrisporobacter petrolearius]
MKKIDTYTFNEFLTQDKVNKIDKQIEILKRDKNKYMMVVLILALILNPSIIYADKVTAIGDTILNKIQMYMAIVATIMCSIELASELAKGGRGYFQIIFKYATGYLALILAPIIFEIIRDLF